ncbi:MAG: hypothetical protein IPK18_00820 [Sphingobacteriales bacterium]|nr:MAG: hypothetical protein IPK18_00820 [Sphingobacteriales bacterium]
MKMFNKQFFKHKIITLILLLFLGFTSNAQLFNFTPPVEDEQPSIQEIIKRIEDTLSIRQGKVKSEDIKLATDKLQQINPTKTEIGTDKKCS